MSAALNPTYGGIDNLEVMAGAVNYLRFLNDGIAGVAGPARAAPRLLDFGAGSGTHALDMRRRGYGVDCVEVDSSLQASRHQSGFSAVDHPSALEPSSYDLVYSMNVLEHIDDDREAVAGLARVLRSGGRLVVFVPAFEVLYSSMDAKVGHVRRYRRRGLIDVVEQGGFHVDECRYVDSLGFAASLAYRAVGDRHGAISESSVGFYDRFVFPVSRGLDRGLGRVIGKNLLLVATRRGPTPV